ncbi:MULTISPECIES: helix-turn-helix domain-containing protein [Fischerella]|nr:MULTISPECIES: helix-turn-helix transcriptional regulator [Fischerella]
MTEQTHRKALCLALRDLREQSGLTQEQLAQKLEVTQSWVSKLENAQHDHTFESIIAYLYALNPEFEFEISFRINGETIATASTDLLKLLE